MIKPKAWYNGYDAKIVEINEMSWEAARDKFNLENPPGQQWKGSEEGLQYASGEFSALSDKMKR